MFIWKNQVKLQNNSTTSGNQVCKHKNMELNLMLNSGLHLMSHNWHKCGWIQTPNSLSVEQYQLMYNGVNGDYKSNEQTHSAL